MNFDFWADATAATHFLIILAVVVGLLVCFRYKRFRPLEAGILLAIVVLWSYYGNCPLTILEEKLRTLAGHPTGITNVGFLPFYANKFLGVALSSRLVQRSTFFSGGAIFTASIEWLRPYLHFHVFGLRRTLRHLLGMKVKMKRRYA
ncbi:DUF2784 family protein [Candidatus Parcubacteria bacterium]|nr:DUF2784 family protein [Candidatus Parcubacteria bacterium]